MFKQQQNQPQQQRIAIFIDAGNLWGVYKAMGKLLNLSKLENFFANKFKGKVYKIFYYVAYPLEGTRPQEKIKKFHNFLTYLKKGLKFEVVKKPLKTINIRDSEGNLIHDQITGKPQTIEKGNLDVELTIDAIINSRDYDVAIFVTGDSDFLPLVSFLRNLSKNRKVVYIFSTH